MGRMPDLTPLVWLAMFGLFCAGVSILGVLAGVTYFIANHVQLVW